MDRKKRVLLVDDEAGIRKILRLFIEKDEFEVSEASSAIEAREVLSLKKPDLIILDVLLDGQTGFEFCEWVKSHSEFKDIVVVLFTALNQDHDLEEGKRVGADHYFVKPQNPKDIAEKVIELLK